MLRGILATFVAVAIFGSTQAFADEDRDYTISYKKAEYEDVFQDLQDAVINQGLVIDYVGHINDMLTRTAAAATDGSGNKSPFRNANFIQFCSSALTHEVVRIKPQNLATCPYVIFIYQTHEDPDRIAVGYRNPELGVPGPTRFVMEKVEALLKTVVAEAVSE